MATFEGIVKRGHRVASGEAKDSPYPKGTIEMQAPHFKERGLNLNMFHLATLNVSIEPQEFRMLRPACTLKGVEWAPGFAAEDFSFSRCRVFYAGSWYHGLVYYPHPESKIDHFHDSSTIEIIAEFIAGISYGEKIVVEYNHEEIEIRLQL